VPVRDRAVERPVGETHSANAAEHAGGQVEHAARERMLERDPLASHERALMSEIEVRVVSLEEADHGTAEFWVGDRLFGFTRLEEGELVLTIEPSHDGHAVSVNAHKFYDALAEAKRLLESY
jgi:hypothetical protein